MKYLMVALMMMSAPSAFADVSCAGTDDITFQFEFNAVGEPTEASQLEKNGAKAEVDVDVYQIYQTSAEFRFLGYHDVDGTRLRIEANAKEGSKEFFGTLWRGKDAQDVICTKSLE